MSSYVTVHDEKRIPDFERVFGSTRVPVKEQLPVPMETSIPAGVRGKQVSRLCYFLDVDALAPEQLEALIIYSMERFGMSRAECETELPHGFPILADDTTFESDGMDFL